MTKKDYTADDIKVLTDREHVRLRTQVYLGNTERVSYSIPLFTDTTLFIKNITFVPAVYKAVGEIIDNSIDEFAQVYSKRHKLVINSDPKHGKYTITDNGRGIPIDKHKSGKFTPEVALGSLRAGRNFVDNKEAGVIGMNGVGSACTNYLSTEFSVKINRDKKEYTQLFLNGAKTVKKPKIKPGPARTGTQVSFTLDDSILKEISLPDELMRNRALELAFTNPGVEVVYNNETFKYRKGLEDIVKSVVDGVLVDESKYFKFEIKTDEVQMEFFVIFGINQEIDEQIFTWVNSSLLFDGGICNTQFLNAFNERTINHLEKEAKKQKCKITKNDVRQNLLVLANLKISDPQYDAQSKTRLTGPGLRKEMDLMLAEGWSLFARRNKEWFEEVLERAYNRHHSGANKKAIDEHKKNLHRKVPGLDDANNRNRSKCQLLITEGQSAAGQILEVRKASVHASFALTGKINNVYDASPAEVLQMSKLTNLLLAIGLIPGHKCKRENLRFGKIIISTDADPDGADIFSLLVNLFFKFWPELFEDENKPVVYRLNAPNVVASKKKVRKYFPSMAGFLKEEKKYKGWEITYFKGLGSMLEEDWKELLANSDKYMIPIVNDGKMESTMKLLFSGDADERKQWLQ